MKLPYSFLTFPVLFSGLLWLPFTAFSQEASSSAEADPFSATGPSETERWTNTMAALPALRLRIEIWEAPALGVAKGLDDLHDAQGLAKKRAECLEGVPGISLVSTISANLKPMGKVLVESVTERIYPTEYEPPSLPSNIGTTVAKEPPPKNWMEVLANSLTDATPTSFETRNTGTSLEAELMPAGGTEKTWDLRIAVDDVRYLGRDSFGAEILDIGMPVFSSFQTKGEIRLKEGEWKLLSVMEPPRGTDSKPSGKSWVTILRVDAEK